MNLRPAVCSSCGSLLPGADDSPARRQVVEITAAGTLLTEYRRHALRRLACRKLNRGEWSEKAENGAFGGRVIAFIGYLTGRLGISHRDAAETMSELFAVKISLGSISAAQKRLSRTLEKAAFQELIEPIKGKVSEILFAGTLSSHSKTRNTCSGILKLEISLWTFTRIEGVEPTNNQAERALRRAVIWRRKSFGTQSETGSRFVERILTVVTTLQQQRRSVLDYLKMACAAKAEGANIPELLHRSA